MNHGGGDVSGDFELGVAAESCLVGNWSHLAAWFQLVALIWATLIAMRMCGSAVVIVL